MTAATISGRYQVVIPTEVREKLGLKPHEKLMVRTRRGEIVLPPCRKWEGRGLGKELTGAEDATAHVRQLREEWDGRI